MTNTFLKMMVLCVVAAIGFLPRLAEANLVTNGGFESGNFNGWTQTGGTANNFVDSGLSHSGAQSAYFGAANATSRLSQTLTTVAGEVYAVDFWLANLSDAGGNLNSFAWSWGGVVRSADSLNNVGGFDFVHYTAEVVGTGGALDLAFTFRHDATWWVLDDVNLVDTGRNVGNNVPEPATRLLLVSALLLAGFSRQFQRRKQFERLASARKPFSI